MGFNRKRFDRAYIEITNVCNLQCDFCPEVERPARRMSFDLFANILEEVKPLVNEVTFHVMGEPLAHPEFAKFVEACAARSVPIQLTTNGTLLDHIGSDGSKRSEILLNPIFRQINFSLQSFQANTRQTPAAREVGFNNYLTRIFQFTRRALSERPDLYINYRLWNIGTKEANEAGNRQFLEPIRKEFDYELKSEVDVRFRKSRHVTGRLYLHFDSRFEWPSSQRAVLHTEGHCHALRTHFAVLSNGVVVPCCLDKEAGIGLGQITADSPPGEMGRILEGPRARQLRAGFDRGELCESLCQRCSFISRFSNKVKNQKVKNQNSAVKILKDRTGSLPDVHAE